MKIGQQVICIDDSLLSKTLVELSRDVPNWVKKDEKYTIRGFNDNKGIVTGVLLEEITNPIKFFRLVDCYQEPAFKLDRFRVLEKIKDLEIEESKEEVYI